MQWDRRTCILHIHSIGLLKYIALLFVPHAYMQSRRAARGGGRAGGGGGGLATRLATAPHAKV